jgi:hypothetical protein
MKKYNLYSAEGCHLCEQALELCQQAGIAEQVTIIDIVEDDNLVELYGICIPVLEKLKNGNCHHNENNSNKLFWPFTLAEIENLK